MQTLSIRQAETQLQAVVKQAQRTHAPVFLTNEDTAMPVAVLIDTEQYATFAMTPDRVLATRLNNLNEVVDTLENQWHVNLIRQAFPNAFHWHLEGVWEASQQREDPFRQLVVLLQMATRNLKMATFTRQHLALFQTIIGKLRQPKVTLEELAACDHALIQQKFPVFLEFDDELIASYVDES